MLAWCPTLYLLLLFIARNRIDAMVDDAEGLDVLVVLPFALILYSLGGHIAYGIVVARLIPAPRWRARIVLLVLGTLLTSVMIAMDPVHPIGAIVATIAVPAGLGYLAAAPRPTTTGIIPRTDRLAPADAP